jgi:hypothetical protein
MLLLSCRQECTQAAASKLPSSAFDCKLHNKMHMYVTSRHNGLLLLHCSLVAAFSNLQQLGAIPHTISCPTKLIAVGRLQAIMQPGARLIELPRSCQLTYDESSDARVLSLIQQVPDELWGAKLALQVSCYC